MKKRLYFYLILFLVLVIVFVFLFSDCKKDNVRQYIKDNTELSLEEYPQELIEMLRKNPETEDFVLSYPIEKDIDHKIDLSDCINTDYPPCLFQFDKRWGYENYGDGMFAFTGCGPTCLSMVALQILDDKDITPLYVAKLAENNGYYVDGIGSDWSLMTKGAGKLGLYAEELPLDYNVITKHLKTGWVIICAMGPGDFTETGHFIVLSGIGEHNKIKVNDPNSIANSNKLWDYNRLKGQIRNLWCYKEA